jgi:hypothetical protein
MKKKVNVFSLAIVMVLLLSCSKSKAESSAAKSESKIQVAILLDTSNSMDGLIEQAKSRLWDIVNTLTTLKYRGETPKVEIALYEYGNDNLPRKFGYIRQVTPMTTDLDLISEKLFSLHTNGGYEYCGAVIREAINHLEWGSGTTDMKLIYIAGNEEFNQGDVSYKEAIHSALSKNIHIHTIYCGDRNDGINELWKDGADIAKGKYFNINSDAKVRYISTPYDDRISEYNNRLNETYIAYGNQAYEKKQNQMTQDKNAQSISKENYTARAVSKSKSVYNNKSWDLVDRYEEEKSIEKIPKSELPEEMQKKSNAEIQAIIAAKQKERNTIQKEIADLAKKRQEYIDNENKKENAAADDDLGKAINESIVAFAKTNGYTVE